MRITKTATIISMLMLMNSAMAEDFDEPTRPFVAKKVKKIATLTAEKAAGKITQEQLDQQEQELAAGAELLNKASLSVGNGANSITVDALKYTLKLGDNIPLPFLIYTSAPTKSIINKEKVVSSILDIRGGLLNFSIGNRTSEENQFSQKEGICDFSVSGAGGCYYHWRFGVKMGEAPSQNGNDTSYFYSGFASAGIKADFPLYDQVDVKAGYLVFNLNANAHYLNADKISTLFAEKPKNAFASLDAGLTFFIENQLSIAVGGTLGSTDSKISKSSYVKLSLSGQ